MAVELSAQDVKTIIEARKSLGMTQLELSNLAKISQRTIQDLEHKRRNTFEESTIIPLCRALDIDLTELTHSDKSSKATDEKNFTGVRISYRLLFYVGLFALPILIYSSIKLVQMNNNNEVPNSYQRIDWITDPPAEVHPITPKWKEWEEKWKDIRSGEIFNYFHYKNTVNVSEAVNAEFACSYHYVGGTPKIFISFYGNWNPDEEIRIFEGFVRGDSTLTEPFKFVSPDTPGLYRIRIFYATALGPVQSFYGSPTQGMVTSPRSSIFMETKLEVLSTD